MCNFLVAPVSRHSFLFQLQMETHRDQDGLELRSVGGKQLLHSTAEVESGQSKSASVFEGANNGDPDQELYSGHTANDKRDMQRMGKKQEFRVSRDKCLLTLA